LYINLCLTLLTGRGGPVQMNTQDDSILEGVDQYRWTHRMTVYWKVWTSTYEHTGWQYTGRGGPVHMNTQDDSILEGVDQYRWTHRMTVKRDKSLHVHAYF